MSNDSTPEESLKLKSLEPEYARGERDTDAGVTKVGGREVEVREKEFQREQLNNRRRLEGKPEISAEEWKQSQRTATTQYFDEKQREEHLTSVELDEKGGAKLVLGSGEKLEGTSIFVMDERGQIYSEGEEKLFPTDHLGRGAHVHHSSFLDGKEVAGAGEIKTDREGQVKEVTDRSGHYKPGEGQNQQVLDQLEKQGVNLDNVKFKLDRGAEEKNTSGMAREYLEGRVRDEEREKTGKTIADGMNETFQKRHRVVDELKDLSAGHENLRPSDVVSSSKNCDPISSEVESESIGLAVPRGYDDPEHPDRNDTYVHSDDKRRGYASIEETQQNLGENKKTIGDELTNQSVDTGIRRTRNQSNSL